MNGVGQVVSWVVTHASIGAMQLVAFLPLRWIRALGWGLGQVLFVLVRGRRRVTLTNLALCFPERSEADVEASVARDRAEFDARAAVYAAERRASGRPMDRRDL